jgi:hypothetical protein
MIRTTCVILVSFSVLWICAGETRAQIVIQQPGTIPPALPPEVIPVMPSPPVALVRALTVDEFLAGFQPLPGSYEVILIHPRTQCPVKVCFNLPPGCPKKVRYRCHELEFDYGRREVEIHFKRDGRVSVDYD